MEEILQTYRISEATQALLPAMAIDYETIVREGKKTLFVKNTPLHLIKASCLHYFSTYEGRRKGVIHHMGYVQKTPIPLCTRKGIYLFPTHSPGHMDNHWIAPRHVLCIQRSHEPKWSEIVFTDGQMLTINVSLHILQTQMDRTFKCIHRIEGVQGINHMFAHQPSDLAGNEK